MNNYVQQLNNEQLQQKSLGSKKLLEASQANVNHLLGLLKEGGDYNAVGEAVTLQPLSSAEVLNEYNKVEQIWAEYQKHLAVIKQPESSFQALANYSAEQHDTVYNAVDGIVVALTEQSREISRYVSYLQVTGVLLIVAFFSVFVFYFIRQMQRSDAVLEEARQETRDILDSVSEGLFLLDKDMNVGQQHSRALKDILGRERVAGNNFFTLASDMLTSEKKTKCVEIVCGTTV